MLFPGEYIAVTSAPEALCRQYACLGRVERVTIPALSADAGRVGLLSLEGQLLDEVAWDRKFHAPELIVTKGVSFERLDFSASGLEGPNWHSAASTAGYSTPDTPILTGPVEMPAVNGVPWRRQPSVRTTTVPMILPGSAGHSRNRISARYPHL